jgi:hypothetical protein
MTTVTAAHATDVRHELTALRDAIAHEVAAAFEAGDVTWDVIAPLLDDLLDGSTTAAPPVVAVRALGRVLAAHARAAETATADGDLAALTVRLRRLHERLAAVLTP